MWEEWAAKLSMPLLDLKMVKGFLNSSSLTPVNIMRSIIGFTWIVYFWETYLAYRQHKVIQDTKTVPSELVSVMDQATYEKSRRYSHDKSKFGLISSLWNQLFMTAVLYYGFVPYLWKTSGRITGRYGYGREHEITQTAVFCLLGAVVSALLDLPWSYYFTFVIEEQHGFNKETRGFFFKDRLKKFVVMQAIVVPITMCVVYIVKIGGDYFFITLWIFCVILSLVIVTIYADYIQPLFDTFTPLPDGPLRERIEALAASISFPLKKLYIVDGSKRSAHSNAYFYGFFNNKRIVLFDTLLKDSPLNEKPEDKDKDKDDTEEEKDKSEDKKKAGCSDDEILAVLAHELGHWKLNHNLKQMIIFQVNLFLLFAVFSMLYKNQLLFEAFGFKRTRPVIIGLFMIFQYVFLPYNELQSFLLTMLSRRFEFQADSFAKFLNRAADLRGALIKTNLDNLGFPVNDWLFSAWNHSHPPILERIRALGKLD